MSVSEGAGEDESLELVLVAAVAENGVIGADGGIPWHYPEDLAHFKETTMGHPVICGRRTYESIVDRLGEPLPGRTMVVLTTRDLDLPSGAIAVDSVDAARTVAADLADTAYVIGGATVYEQFLGLADGAILTEIPESPEGDARFPALDDEWTERERDDRDALSFVVYERVDAGE